MEIRRGATLDRTGTQALGRAPQYVRMSTEHQRYSTENQGDAILEYAARRGLEVVRTYAGEGKSGLRLDGRDALKRITEDVQTGKSDFTTILVYDVNRWGRFQEADESAYCEYIYVAPDFALSANGFDSHTFHSVLHAAHVRAEVASSASLIGSTL